jgi:hypothetical protein
LLQGIGHTAPKENSDAPVKERNGTETSYVDLAMALRAR